MACFWPLYEEYKRLLQGKNYILDLKRMDSRTVIEIICNEKDMYVEIELFTRNEFYKKFDVVNYGFDEFFVTEIISVKQNYDSTYHFASNRLLKKCTRLIQIEFWTILIIKSVMKKLSN